MELLIPLLVLILIVGLVYWAGTQMIAAFNLPAPVGAVFTVIVVVIAVLALLNLFGLTSGLRLR
jgi:hypothetical protein